MLYHHQLINFLFQPVSKYAADVHFMHIWLPIYFTHVLENLLWIQDSMSAIVNLTQSKSTGSVISYVAIETIKQMQITYDNFVDLV